MDATAELRTLTDLAKRKDSLTPEEKVLFERETRLCSNLGNGRLMSPFTILARARLAALRGKEALKLMPISSKQVTAVDEHYVLANPDETTERILSRFRETGLEVVVFYDRERGKFSIGVSWREN